MEILGPISAASLEYFWKRGDDFLERIDYILDFVVHLGREMLECGANLERVKLSIELILKSYQLREVSIFALSTHISVSAREVNGAARTRQVTVPGSGIHLEKLRRLNDLSYQVCREKPEPKELEDMLYEALMVSGYSTKMVLAGYLLAMFALCRIFGGGWQEIIVVFISTLVLFLVSNYFAREKMNRIITNVACMFLAGCIALFFTYIGFTDNLYTIIITNAFYLIPGIPMVNSVRNILCGNEMNGILELLKVVLEVITIVAGLYIAYFVFGRWYVSF